MSRKRESDETFDSERKIASLRAQNDDLLASLKANQKALACSCGQDDCTYPAVLAAIAKAEETS